MPSATTDYRALLETLVHHQIEFIVVGGVCAVLHGAPVMTFDLDVVHARTPENVDRLLIALQELDALFRDPAGRRLQPGRSHLSSPGHQLLTTRLGNLDLLGTIGANEGYEDLLPRTTEAMVGGGVTVRLLNLPDLIVVKEQAGRDKDKAVLPVLRNTLEEQRRAAGGPS